MDKSEAYQLLTNYTKRLKLNLHDLTDKKYSYLRHIRMTKHWGAEV